MDLAVEDDPDPADVAWLEARIVEQTTAATGHDAERQLAIFGRDNGAVVAGIYGWTWGGCCELQHLWVDDSRRGEGLATQLIEAAEHEAARRGCRQIVLFTHAANAGRDGGRWTRHGYELVARIDDYPIGDAALWYRKALPVGDA